MVQKFCFAVLFSLSVFTVAAQQPQPAPVFNYKKLPSGLEYAFIVDKPTSPKPEEGGQISLNM